MFGEGGRGFLDDLNLMCLSVSRSCSEDDDTVALSVVKNCTEDDNTLALSVFCCLVSG